MTVQQTVFPFPNPSQAATPSTSHVVSAAAAAAMFSHSVTFIDARNPGLHAIERISNSICFASLSPSKTCPLPLPGPASTVVVYDSGSTALSQTFSRASTAISALLAVHPVNSRFCLLAGGLPAVRADAPALLETSLMTSPKALLSMRRKLAKQERPAWARDALDDLASSAAPAAQVLPWLYLGSAADACKLDRLTRFGVTHIVCVAEELSPAFEDGKFEYTHVKAKDASDYDMLAELPGLCEVLADVRAKYARGESVCVLVHCAAGLSRSAAVVVAYLVRHAGFTVDRALEHIQSRRLGADPGRFIEQLRDWENRFSR